MRFSRKKTLGTSWRKSSTHFLNQHKFLPLLIPFAPNYVHIWAHHVHKCTVTIYIIILNMIHIITVQYFLDVWRRMNEIGAFWDEYLDSPLPQGGERHHALRLRSPRPSGEYSYILFWDGILGHLYLTKKIRVISPMLFTVPFTENPLV